MKMMNISNTKLAQYVSSEGVIAARYGCGLRTTSSKRKKFDEETERPCQPERAQRLQQQDFSPKLAAKLLAQQRKHNSKLMLIPSVNEMYSIKVCLEQQSTVLLQQEFAFKLKAAHSK